MCRQNRRAMRQRVWRFVVSATIPAQLAGSSRTLVRQTDGVVAGAARRLKILVSVVRFRPGPPRTSQANRRSMQIGVVVSGIRSPRVRSISGAVKRCAPKLHEYVQTAQLLAFRVQLVLDCRSPNNTNFKAIFFPYSI